VPPVHLEYRKPILRASLRRHGRRKSGGPRRLRERIPLQIPRGDLFWPTETLMNLYNCSDSGKMNHVYPLGLI
jgi:hypothetical protein